MSKNKGWGIEAVGLWLLLLVLETAVAIILIDLFDGSLNDIQLTFVLSVVGAAFTLAVVGAFTKKYGGIVKSLGLNQFKKSYIGKVLGYFVLYFGLMVSASYLVALLYPSFNIDQEQNFGFNLAASNLELVLAFVSLVIITPIIEEVVFRGLIFKGVRRDFGFIPALVISSGIFAILHGQVNVAVDTFILGSVAAYLLEKTNSLWPAILLHGIKNLIAFIVIFFIGL